MCLVFWGSINGWITTCTGHGLVKLWQPLLPTPFLQEKKKILRFGGISRFFNYFLVQRTPKLTLRINIRRGNTFRIKHGREEKQSCSANRQHCQSLVLHELRGWQDCFLRRLQSFSVVCGGIIQLSRPFCGQIKLFKPCSTQVKRVIKIHSRMCLLLMRHVSSSTHFIAFPVLSLLIFPECYLTHTLALSHKALLFGDQTMAFPTRELAKSIGWCGGEFTVAYCWTNTMQKHIPSSAVLW